MYKRNVVIYIKDILDNMEKSERFVVDLTYEDFISD